MFFRSPSRDPLLATDCLGNIIEVVSHSRKNTVRVWGNESGWRKKDLVNEKIAAYTAKQRWSERLCNVENKTV